MPSKELGFTRRHFTSPTHLKHTTSPLFGTLAAVTMFFTLIIFFTA